MSTLGLGSTILPCSR